MTIQSAATTRSVALLERAIGYTRGALSLVTVDLLDAATPCSQWDLEALLRHMDDSLAAFVEAGAVGYVDLTPAHDLPTADRLVQRLRLRACAILDAWTARGEDEPIAVGGAPMPASLIAGVGAVEVAVHGWDVARACGADLPIPPRLADELIDVAESYVSHADRPARFAPVTGVGLLGFLGR